MNLTKFPRRCYTDYPTPIVFLSNLTEILGGPSIYMKRDDLLGLAVGSSKTRKLEFLIADAIEKGADTIITCGDVQSNHCCLTLSAACKENLKCHLLLEERVPDSYDEMANGNNFLYKLMAAEELHVLKGKQNLLEEMQKVADKLTAMGRKPYIIPGGDR